MSAAPEPCVRIGTTITCSGDQSSGIDSPRDFSPPPLTTVVTIRDLTTDIAPASSGVSAVYVTTSASNGGKGADAYTHMHCCWEGIPYPDGHAAAGGGAGATGAGFTINFAAGDFGISTTETVARGIVGVGYGGNGGNGGSSGGDLNIFFSSGARGGNGGTGSSITINSMGSIETANTLSFGIQGYSKGGKGGNGGYGTFGFASNGGNGGNGGSGGTLRLNNQGDVLTRGSYAHGIYGESRAGNGGTGGNADALYATGGDGGVGGAGGAIWINNGLGASISTLGYGARGIGALSAGGIGGNGGAGGGLYGGGGAGSTSGSGGLVDIRNYGSIDTAGVRAKAIYAQSIGGFSGTGGGGEGLVGYGGTSLSAGSGGTVNILNDGHISTIGTFSSGIFAQSIGGGGGSAGGSGGVVGLGGAGGAAGHGGQVTVTVGELGEILTQGDDATGIYAQSIGGGGGDGSGTGGLVSIGGAGGASGSGSTVTVFNKGYISTQGKDSLGMFSQSVGGGGGDGGISGGLVSIGGSSTVAGYGGAIVSSNTGTITTSGDLSAGVYAQSIGGGGGKGAGSGGAVSIGGSGSGGGSGGLVSVTNDGTIETTGGIARGIFAQSVGGGGGDGAGSGGAVSLGGHGSGGGSGGTVLVNNTGVLTISGINSNAIQAQSIGGGGGSGAGSGGAVSLGGGSSSSGHGGTVTVTNSGAVTTMSSESRGIFSQSIGGGGGDGAGSGGVVSIGGSGSSGGNGGVVSLTNSGIVITSGSSSDAIFAQSVGGGGGSGSGSGGAVSIGGTGLGGGIGGTVTLTNSGNVFTDGYSSVGLFGQSVGGGGGIGAGSVGLVSLGGSGSLASSGGAVSIKNSGVIDVKGNGSQAIFAQSIGGGGGKAGFSGGWVSIGGTGGGGGDGSSVAVTNDGGLTTVGNDAAGLFAQSIGGGGGMGGDSGAIGAFFSVSVGGSGGAGGNGSAVVVDHETLTASIISTLGERSSGISASSVGGGGGAGGFSFAGSAGIYVSGSVSVGGSGGDGGSGSTVSVANINRILTAGKFSNGIAASSIGGGGGTGGLSVAASLSDKLAASLSIGGSGGLGGNASSVAVQNEGDIDTQGVFSHAIIATSIGGGGGIGGLSISAGVGGFNGGASVGGSGGSGGSASTVVVNNSGFLTTLDDDASGIHAQSLGGGGGSGGLSVAAGVTVSGPSVNVSVGGFAGNGNVSSNVSVTNNGDVFTQGTRSYGILSQSAGGGGGTGGMSIAGTLAVNKPGLSVSLGGEGGNGNTGALADIDNFGNIQTNGESAHALFAQSIGGGGGAGGMSLAAAIGSLSGGVSVGGFGGTGSSSSNVTILNEGNLTTLNDNASGIHAQSLGGGGGDGGMSVGAGVAIGDSAVAAGISIGGFGGSGNTSGIVDVTNSGEIMTSGKLSYGILGQSIGGGGGTGGLSASLGASAGGTGGLAVAVGGMGGDGNNANNVNIANQGGIQTSGKGAHGVLAQSTGGGGGTGGIAGSLALSMEGKTSIAIGGSFGGTGGIGGNAGAVSVINSGNKVETAGKGAKGIFAQSVGGGGGDGGLAATLSLSAHGKMPTAISLALGGTGGQGGTGSSVDVNNSATVVTGGKESHAIFAQSLGGGGGTGGAAITGSLGGQNALPISVSLGGIGGIGNTGGNVNLINSGSITTTGRESVGLYAESIGGTGGDGGLSFSGSFGGPEAKNITVSLGGNGGTGNTGGNVTVAHTGSIDTSGYFSSGVVGRSIGGGGGNGGFAGSAGLGYGGEKIAVNLGVSLGGSGGAGGLGGLVNINTDGDIRSTGYGIFAQSIGGGGGEGGSSFTGLVGFGGGKEGVSVNAAVAVGGGGGIGNHGGAVTVTHGTGLIETTTGGAHGIFAQSAGGGGGVGGRANTLSMILGKPPSGSDLTKAEKVKNFLYGGNNYKFTVSVGGNGAGGGDGDIVTVTNNASVSTQGKTAHGIFAQSIGGGGGEGGNGILGVSELLPGPADLIFSGINLLAGGVSQLKNLDVAVGGSAGASGNGALVSVSNSGSVTTQGEGSHGIFAQSIGGGGGNGGNAVTGVVGKVGIGGSGGASGNGGDVNVNHSGEIETFGDAAYGIFAQSVGGGGGTSGNIKNAMLAPDEYGVPWLPSVNFGIGLDFGGNGGGGGDGGNVTLNTSGAIITHGAGAHAIVVQSVGGGGGIKGDLGADADISLPSFTGSVGDAGSGGDITVIHTGNIVTTGDDAHGVFVQSAGGQGTGGTLTLELTGSILTYGNNSDAYLIQSIGDFSQSNIVLTVPVSMSVQGGISGTGIKIMDGLDNLVTNSGTITTMDGIDGWAIYAGSGNELIDNFGTITGSVFLGSGLNSFTNQTLSTFNSGPLVYLGAGNLLTNNGTLLPGGGGNIGSTQLIGDYLQTSGGTFAADLDPSQFDSRLGADLLNISGTAALAGSVELNIVNSGFARPGNHLATILTATGTVIDREFLTLVPQPQSAVTGQYQLIFPNSMDVAISYEVDYAPDGMNDNQTDIGDYINRLQLAGGSTAFAEVGEILFAIPDVDMLTEAYDRLSPEIYVDNVTWTLMSNLQFTDRMINCDAGSDYLLPGQHHCSWSRAGFSSLSRNKSEEHFGFEQKSAEFAGGKHFKLGKRGHIGYALSYARANYQSDDLSEGSSDLVQTGLMLEYSKRGTELSLGLAGGWGRYKTERTINLVENQVAESDAGQDFFAAQVQVSKGYEFGHSILKPSLGMAASYVYTDGFTEKGAGGANLKVLADKDIYLTVLAGLGYSGEIMTNSALLIQPYINLGFNYLTGRQPEVSAMFPDSPSMVKPLTVDGAGGRLYSSYSVGMQFFGKKGKGFHIEAGGQLGRETGMQAISIKLGGVF